MKIKLYETQTQRVEKEYECKLYTIVPGWVWPFACDYCYWDIESSEQQVVANLDGKDNIKHFHLDCWNKVTKHE